eukprot:7766982-Alexandrium_andersonii.AAC.1
MKQYGYGTNGPCRAIARALLSCTLELKWPLVSRCVTHLPNASKACIYYTLVLTVLQFRTTHLKG